MGQIILGLVGPIASGKGTIADHFKKLGFHIYSLSDVVREEAKSRGLPLTRENLQNIGDELRFTFGRQVLAERVLQLVTDPEKNMVFDSIRNPGEIDYLKHILKINIIGLDAPIELRMRWYLDRATRRGEDNPDMTAFTEATLRDRGHKQSVHGQQVDECLRMANVHFFNNKTEKDLIQEVNKYLKKDLHFDPEVHRRSKEK